MPTVSNQKIVLGMIVRDEAHVILECLNSVARHIDYYVINDNGSTDGTQDLIRKFFEEKGIPGEIIDTPWKDFGFNRTAVFKACEGKGDYVLVIDADDLWQGDKPLPHLLADSYFLDLESGAQCRYKRKQIFRNNMAWEYKGVLHEYAFSPNEKTSKNLDGYHIVSRRLGARNKPGKELRDIQTLLQGIVEEPDNARYYFYLAQTYRDAGQFQNAVQAYEQRIQMGGWTEEVFYSHYQKGEYILMVPDYPNVFEELLMNCLRALEVHPTRSEAIYTFVRFCRLTGRYLIGYHFGKMGLSIPYPKGDILFVNSTVYQYALADETAVCCSWLNKPAETVRLYEQALASPEMPMVDKLRVETNLLKWRPLVK